MKLFFSLFSFIGTGNPGKQLQCYNQNQAYNKILDLHDTILHKRGWQSINNTYLYANKSDTLVYTRYYSNYLFRKVRVTQLSSPETFMLHSVWYPHYIYDAPVLSINVAKFNANASLCFMNIGERKKNEYAPLFGPFLEEYASFKENKTKHLMQFEGILSDSMVYKHIYSGDTWDEIPEVIQNYLNAYFSIFDVCTAKPESANDAKMYQVFYDAIFKGNEKQFLYKSLFPPGEWERLVDRLYHYKSSKY